MGFSFGTVAHLVHLGKEGSIPRGARVLDFGSQNIAGELGADNVRSFFEVFGGAIAEAETIKEGDKAERLMQLAGFDYTAFDVYESGRTKVFDLNCDAIPAGDVGTYDVVMNYGTSEHVINQYNVFKVAHDALKVGGVMLNSVPFYGTPEHGFFNYHPKFFTALIKANGYKALNFELSDIFRSGYFDHYHGVAAAENGEKWEFRYTGCALLAVFFQKTTDAPFRAPIDYEWRSLISEIYERRNPARPPKWLALRLVWRLFLRFTRPLLAKFNK